MGAVNGEVPVVVAVDGGGSKTDVVVLGLTGELLDRRRGDGSSLQLSSLGKAVSVIDEVVAGALAAVPGHRLIAVHAYLSGIDFPEEIAAFRSAAATMSWLPGGAEGLVVGNDVFALLRAGTDEADAVAVVCGTGINALGVRGDGVTVRFPAVGEISGDWGGGAHLGGRALWHAARAVDGRGPATRLVGAIPPALGLADIGEVIHDLHFGTLPREALAGLSPLVFAVAEEGDTVAGDIVDRQAHEIVLLAESALRRLGLLDAKVPVVLGGGVIGGGHRRLLDGVVDGLAERAPHATARVVAAPPLLGAALLALEAVGADERALAEARAALARAVPQPRVGLRPPSHHGPARARVPAGSTGRPSPTPQKSTNGAVARNGSER